MQNFLDVAQEIHRRDLTDGGVINQNLVISSSVRVQGDLVCNSSSTYNARMDFKSAHLVGGGLWRQYVSSTAIGYMNFAAIQIPYDDTIPQLSEGAQLLVATVTAVNASSKLMFDATINVSEHTNNCDFGVLCLFQDSTANALSCNHFQLNDVNTLSTGRLHYVSDAPDTSAHYYTLTIGSNANLACIEVNGSGGARKYGGKLISTFEVFEFEGR